MLCFAQEKAVRFKVAYWEFWVRVETSGLEVIVLFLHKVQNFELPPLQRRWEATVEPPYTSFRRRSTCRPSLSHFDDTCVVGLFHEPCIPFAFIVIRCSWQGPVTDLKLNELTLTWNFNWLKHQLRKQQYIHTYTGTELCHSWWTLPLKWN